MPNKKININPITVVSLPMEIENGAIYSIAQPNPNNYTHIFFKYPCRFIPEIPRWAIKKYISHKNNAIVFDPFSGSGTTLLESIINGYDAFGTEIDSIAKLIIKVKTTTLSEEQLSTTLKTFDAIIAAAIDETKPLVTPKINNLNHWFIDSNIKQLGKMLYQINEITDEDIKDFLKVCFISIIKKTSNADNVSPKPYVSNKVIKTPSDPIKEFKNIFKRYYEAIRELSAEEIQNKAMLTNGDALNICFNDEIDLAITSPPYINAFDYGRTLRLENLWLGTLTEDELRNKKKSYVGTEQVKICFEEQNLGILSESTLLKQYYEEIYPLDKKRALIVKKFFEDMKKNLQEIYHQLATDGHYMIVIGNSKIRNIEVESWKVLEQIAVHVGYEIDTYFSYIIQNPYIRIPRGNKGGKINSDHILVLKKRG